jgi:hypothetical protein
LIDTKAHLAVTNKVANNEAEKLGLTHKKDFNFSVKVSQLPESFISYKLAYKILFIGRSLRIIKSVQDKQYVNKDVLTQIDGMLQDIYSNNI